MTEYEPQQSTEDASRNAPITDTAAGAEPAEEWWKTALYSVGMLAATAYFYVYITGFEAGTTATTRVWWPVALIYNVAGKWPVVGLGVLGGLVLAAMAVGEFRKRAR